MSELPEVDPLVPTIAFVKVNYKRPTGQIGPVYILPGAVVAVGAVDATQCQVLLSTGPEWLAVQVSAEAFLGMIGGAVPKLGALPA